MRNNQKLGVDLLDDRHSKPSRMLNHRIPEIAMQRKDSKDSPKSLLPQWHHRFRADKHSRQDDPSYSNVLKRYCPLIRAAVGSSPINGFRADDRMRVDESAGAEPVFTALHKNSSNGAEINTHAIKNLLIFVCGEKNQ